MMVTHLNFITIGQKLGREAYYKYFEAFGFTEKTGIDLPGEARPVPALKGQNYGTYHPLNNFSVVDLASTSYGQTVAISPIQIITATCAIANGGKLMQPYIVSATVDSDGNVLKTFDPVVKRQVISEKTSALVRSMMESVVQSGTGRNCYIAGYHVAGKTATSQDLNKLRETGKEHYSGSFVCFAPADDPQVAILIIMDEPQGAEFGGSIVAAPVAREVMEKTLTYLNVEPDFEDGNYSASADKTSNYVGQSVSYARQTAANQGYSTRVYGSGSKVIAQTPVAGTGLSEGGIIILYTDEGTLSQFVDMPDFSGVTYHEAIQKANKAGINISYYGPSEKTGALRCAYQSVLPGTKVLAGSFVNLTFNDTSVTDED